MQNITSKKTKIFALFAVLLLVAFMGLAACSVFDPIEDLINRGFNIEVRFEANGGSFRGTNVHVVAVRLRPGQRIPRPGVMHRPPETIRQGYLLNPTWHRALLDEHGNLVRSAVLDENGYYLTREIPVLDDYGDLAFIQYVDEYGVPRYHGYYDEYDRFVYELIYDDEGNLRPIPVLVPHTRTEIIYDFEIETTPWDFSVTIDEPNSQITLVAMWTPIPVFRLHFDVVVTYGGVPSTVSRYIDHRVITSDGTLGTFLENMDNLRMSSRIERTNTFNDHFVLNSVFTDRVASLDRSNRLNHELDTIVHRAWVPPDDYEGDPNYYQPGPYSPRTHDLFTTWIFVGGSTSHVSFVYGPSDFRTSRGDAGGVNVAYYLENDIDFAGWYRSHSQSAELVHDLRSTIFGNAFTGRIYGNGFTVSNINLSFVNEFGIGEASIGLFSTFMGSMIDVSFHNVSIDVAYSAIPPINNVQRRIGFFAGWIFPQANIRNVAFSGDLILDLTEPLAGPLDPHVWIVVSQPRDFVFGEAPATWPTAVNQADITFVDDIVFGGTNRFFG